MRQPEAGEKKFTGLIPSWHHVDCFLEALSELDAEGVTAEELSGFTKLKKEDKDELKGKFAAKSGGAAKAGYVPHSTLYLSCVKRALCVCVCVCVCVCACVRVCTHAGRSVKQQMSLQY